MKEALHQAGGGQLPKDPRKTSQQASRVRDAPGLGGHHLSTVLIEMLMFFSLKPSNSGQGSSSTGMDNGHQNTSHPNLDK